MRLKKKLIYSIAVAAISVPLTVGNISTSVQAESCYSVGNSVYCSDGFSAYSSGNSIYGNDGFSAYSSGNSIYSFGN